MFLRHLSLASFRSYLRLDLTLPQGTLIFWGDNGEGKSNLLEAVYLLATSRSFRTSNEREMINWEVTDGPAFARVAGDVHHHSSTTRLEVLVAEVEPGSTRRRVRINGHERPLAELLGHLNAVLFSPADVELVAGPAETRRRYLDITLCQIDGRYLRTLRRYQRVLTQRNALLRQLRERPVAEAQFEFWDEQLTALGAELLVSRLRALGVLNHELDTIFPQLAGEGASLRLLYRSTVPTSEAADAVAEGPPTYTPAPAAETIAALQRRFQEHLLTLRARERQQGVTLAGVHRDDLSFEMGARDLRTYGSRGQQRTAALGLKLAEVRLMQLVTGDQPVLLLDDVMSELDPARQRLLQAAVAEHEQVLLSATDLGVFDPTVLARAARFRVRRGSLDREE